ncbi:DEAD/DEAH box helicase [Aureibacillus halotolerans]|uniref:Helicase-like protein n=1 Tax=Aureibacillus halotolerans TaxID=1508390 RepID=A0A4R6U1P0_9BACI|nr:DEAD/DEAH box helicase [Aureibacillus halotolerans]TDQ39222.1 helicase-like protein [Aureibacillus halotolerans]
MAIKFNPHSYQEYATKQIIDNKKYALFLDMGLGKTVSTLTAIDELMNDHLEVNKVLVIAPLRVARDTWSREAQKWEHTKHLTVSKVLGTEKQRRQALMKEADIYVINRDNVVWLVEHYREKGREIPFDMLVVDELSSFKAPDSERFKNLRKISPLFKRFVGLTGTPAPNSLLDLWSQVYLIDRGKRLGQTQQYYKMRYFYPVSNGSGFTQKHLLRPEAEKNIYELIDDICVSMRSKDHIKLPDRVDNIITVNLSDKERALYKELEKEKILQFEDGDIVANSAGALSQKLLQLSNGASYNEDHGVKQIHNRKMEALEEIVEEAQGQSILLFYSFQHDRDRIKKKFKNAVTLDDHDDVIADWNAGKIDMLICHPASAGHGLNLQDGGHIMVWFGLTWSLELYQQANARLHRQGQEETVVIHHILTANTIDQKVLKVLQGKEKGQYDLLDAVKAQMEAVSDDDSD